MQFRSLVDVEPELLPRLDFKVLMMAGVRFQDLLVPVTHHLKNHLRIPIYVS